LEERGERAVPKGPPIWICGDCHAGNLGPLPAPDGRIHVQIRDVDQTDRGQLASWKHSFDGARVKGE
jgi:uncharacterized protein (DUF2252 family)